MTDEKIQTLRDKFSLLSRAEIVCGDGWYDLIHNTCSQLSEKINGNNAPSQEKPHIASVGRIFGGLRIVFVGPEPLHEITRQAEHASHVICEECGQPGSQRFNKWKWERIFCENCATHFGFTETQEPVAATV